MAKWTCEQCGDDFVRDKAGSRPIRFCSQACYRIWRKASGTTGGQFTKGGSPWNKGLKGIHLSPATQFRPGQKSKKILPVGSVRTRRRSRDGSPRAFIKIANPNSWRERAIVVWEAAHGPVPRGWVVHHKDRNPLNDAIENLEAMSRSNHIAEHRSEVLEARSDKS